MRPILTSLVRWLVAGAVAFGVAWIAFHLR
ncbi:hypothetical protein OPKNFCMD_3662 [Methylobacterium crusticola]|uniref:Uncharacterized protein n=1 Tax=Methylobacterium crusticola TaxID=1697972 RepID=A0ABQ4R060_9HYPH|nr:hypothetical protein OPKNFCMD_3662 [Methylobacterium crusticola]